MVELIFLILAVGPLVVSILKSNRTDGTVLFNYFASLAIGACSLFLGKFIGWGSIVVGMAVFYLMYYKLDDYFRDFIREDILGLKG